jgi:CDP-diacylglycerol--serine O-phosphatidyltransferase
MWVVKKNYMSYLNIPISSKLFGANKTWRGFIVLPLLCGLWVVLLAHFSEPIFLQTIDLFLFGIGLGLAYMLAELPNSFIKRRLGIANGEYAKNYKWLQIFVDKADSVLVVLLFYTFVHSLDFNTFWTLFFISISLHFTISYILVALKIKKSL